MAKARPHETADRERRCIATREALPRGALIRFACSPDGAVSPDLAEKLPGRGAWVAARREAVETAMKRGAFARAFERACEAADDLADRIEAGLAARCLATIGRARAAGALIAGFDKVSEQMKAPGGVAVLVEASDGAVHGRDRLLRLAAVAGIPPVVIGCFESDQLGLALGLEHVIHAALVPGGMAEALMRDARRLEGFRPLTPDSWADAARNTGRGELGRTER